MKLFQNLCFQCWEIVESLLRVRITNYEALAVGWYCRLVTSNLRSRNIFKDSRIRFWDFRQFLTIFENAKTCRIFVKTRKCYKTTLDNMKEVNFDQQYLEICWIWFWIRQKLMILNQKWYRKYSKIGVGSLESFLLVNLGWGQLWFTVEVNSKY